jgi:hypothetical protein
MSNKEIPIKMTQQQQQQGREPKSDNKKSKYSDI